MGKEKPLKIQDSDKLNVLCLHGYRQSGELFKSKTGSFRKFCKSYANFTYIDAPHLAKPMNEGDEEVEEQKSWWFNKDDRSFKGTNQSGPAFGFEESLKVVEEAWKSGDYQGLMGFSQGSCFVSVICSLSERNCKLKLHNRLAVTLILHNLTSFILSDYHQTKICDYGCWLPIRLPRTQELL